MNNPPKKRWSFSLRYSVCRFPERTFRLRVLFWSRRVGPRHEHIDRWHDEQGEHRSYDHSADQHDTDAVAGSRSRTSCEYEWEVTTHGGGGCHQDGAQPGAGGFDDRSQLGLSCFLKMVGKLHDEDTVLSYQTDQRDQTDLTINVECRQSEKREHQRPGKGQRHRARQNDERIAKAFELSCQNQVDQDGRKQESSKELASLDPQLACFTGIVDREAL